LSFGARTLYARDDAHRAELEATEFKGKKVDVSRFKGLGEMNPNQLKQTTMDPATRSLLKITLPDEYQDQQAARDIVERLMGVNGTPPSASNSSSREPRPSTRTKSTPEGIDEHQTGSGRFDRSERTLF
jgi:hypothetical protein